MKAIVIPKSLDPKDMRACVELVRELGGLPPADPRYAVTPVGLVYAFQSDAAADYALENLPVIEWF